MNTKIILQNLLKAENLAVLSEDEHHKNMMKWSKKDLIELVQDYKNILVQIAKEQQEGNNLVLELDTLYKIADYTIVLDRTIGNLTILGDYSNKNVEVIDGLLDIAPVKRKFRDRRTELSCL
ncbi:MAG: hypothetical protein M9949_06075 [Candidatus Kapabacteria bacterium]|nr:hypothetical protein [Candidatus Kapabacteria bacterium]